MISVQEINELHQQTVALWHEHEIENTFDGYLSVVCQQHQFNFLLWHEEDIARSRDVTDTRIAEVKRAIDGYNQQRNDWIEKIDDWIAHQLIETKVQAPAAAPFNTETPGCAIDRLSILSLRIYHMLEQLEREDASDEHKEKVNQKLSICYAQQRDLTESLQALLDDIFAGRKQHKIYRQFKMYNDPTLNPYLYKQAS